MASNLLITRGAPVAVGDDTQVRGEFGRVFNAKIRSEYAEPDGE
jgi:hypothetical protein